MPEPAPDDLAGLRVLVARPAGQIAALANAISAAGGRVIALPLVEIAPVADAASVAERLAGARDAARWLFTSRNAVEHAAALCPQPWPPCAAVGAGTAAALQALTGAPALHPAQGDGAAALLAEPALQAVAGQRLVIVTGEGTLPILANGLEAAGAQVAVIAVYRRQPLTPPPERVAEAVHGADIAILPSAEAVRRLLALTPVTARGRLLSLPLALPSARVLETARGVGFTGPAQVPERVSDAAWLALLRRYARDRFRPA